MPHPFRRLLERIATEKAPGPSPAFSIFHLLRAIELVGEKPVGRSKLAENLSVGEGTVRTIVERLRSAGLIATSKAGCTLTSKGLTFWKEYRSVFKKGTEIGRSELTLADCNFAILVKDHEHKVKSGVEQRDAAVMAGAKGATTMIFKKKRLTFPSVSNGLTRDFSRATIQIVKLLEPEEDDVIVIGSADSPAKAEYGALAAAWTLLDD